MSYMATVNTGNLCCDLHVRFPQT